MTSRHGNVFRVLVFCEGIHRSPVDFSDARPIMRFPLIPYHNGAQTNKLPVIWDAMALVSGHRIFISCMKVRIWPVTIFQVSHTNISSARSVMLWGHLTRDLWSTRVIKLNRTINFCKDVFQIAHHMWCSVFKDPRKTPADEWILNSQTAPWNELLVISQMIQLCLWEKKI